MMDVMCTGPSHEQALLKTPAVHEAMACSVQAIARCHTARNEKGNGMGETCRQRGGDGKHRDRGQEKGQGVIALGRLMMFAMSLFERAQRAVKQPAMKAVFD